MSATTTAAVAIRGERLWYAEVEQNASTRRVRRVAHRALEFDASRLLYGQDAEAASLDALATVLGEIITATPSLGIAVHPTDAYSLFVPLEAGLAPEEREQRISQRIALATGEQSVQQFRVIPTPVRTEEDPNQSPFEWVHVLAVPTSADARMTTLLESLPVDACTWTVTTEAAARALPLLRPDSKQEDSSYMLAVGQYPAHTEFSLVRNQTWHHAQYTEEAEHPENQVYFAVGFLNRLGVSPEAISRVFAYGEAVDPAAATPFEEALGQPPERLDLPPDLAEQTEGGQEESSAYVPCVGAALKKGES